MIGKGLLCHTIGLHELVWRVPAKQTVLPLTRHCDSNHCCAGRAKHQIYEQEGPAFMKTETFNRTGEQVKANLAEMADKARDITVKVKEQWDDAYHDLERGVRRARFAAEDRIDDVRRQIKSRPLTVVASVAAGSFAIGVLTGLLLGKKARE